MTVCCGHVSTTAALKVFFLKKVLKKRQGFLLTFRFREMLCILQGVELAYIVLTVFFRCCMFVVSFIRLDRYFFEILIRSHGSLGTCTMQLVTESDRGETALTQCL